jgi:exodeoxyribonuclease VII large subunit
MLRVIRRKNPLVNVLLFPVKVQGPGAAEEIAEAVRTLNDEQFALDVLIVARGGGSFEDLFCFSDEQVVRAIFESKIPVITGIGHEPDFSLADAVSDYSASTPTAAAERAVPDYEQLRSAVLFYQQDLFKCMEHTLKFSEQRLDYTATAFVDQCHQITSAAQLQLDRLSEQLVYQMHRYVEHWSQVLARQAAELEVFSPLGTLARGYSIASRADGSLLSSCRDVHLGDKLQLRLQDGQLECEVLGYGDKSEFTK